MKFLEKLNPGDHEFIPEAMVMRVIPKRKLEIPETPEIEARWKDFVAEKKSRGLQAKDGDLVVTRLDSCRQKDIIYEVGAFFGKFKPWVTTRPAFTYSSGVRPGAVKGFDIYSLGTGGLFFVEDSGDPKYMLFGSRHWREVGGEIDTVPAGFLKTADLSDIDPALTGFRREAREEIIEPETFLESGVMKSDYWRNLTAIYDTGTEMKNIEQAFDLQEEGDIVILKRETPRVSKYGEEGLFMVPLGTLDRYVSENLEKYGDRRFGERAALLLKRYFERA